MFGDCREDQYRVGPVAATCLQDGSWNSSLPYCVCKYSTDIYFNSCTGRLDVCQCVVVQIPIANTESTLRKTLCITEGPTKRERIKVYQFFLYFLSNSIPGLPRLLRPPIVISLNSSALYVTWRPPVVRPRGVMTAETRGFLLSYYEVRQATAGLFHWQNVTLAGGSRNVTSLNTLNPYSIYSLRVVPCRDEGCHLLGIASPSRTVRTKCAGGCTQRCLPQSEK